MSVTRTIHQEKRLIAPESISIDDECLSLTSATVRRRRVAMSSWSGYL